MLKKSDFKKDLKSEMILGQRLDTIYNKLNYQFERQYSDEIQHAGVDLIINHNNQKYYIDEKAQLHYINKSLPTFAFEISYLKNKQWKEGWLNDENKKTTHYFLITSIYLNENKTQLQSSSDISKIKITSINREKLITYLKAVGLDKKRLLDYEAEIRSNNNSGKTFIKELNQNIGSIWYSEGYAEKPINLVLYLNPLIELQIAKNIYHV